MKKPLSRVSPVQYSSRRQSRWVLADYGGKDWNETTNVWWKVRVVSRWEVNYRVWHHQQGV